MQPSYTRDSLQRKCHRWWKCQGVGDSQRKEQSWHLNASWQRPAGLTSNWSWSKWNPYFNYEVGTNTGGFKLSEYKYIEWSIENTFTKYSLISYTEYRWVKNLSDDSEGHYNEIDQEHMCVFSREIIMPKSFIAYLNLRVSRACPVV